jgi:membrane protease YdiL (CAAX protease family)
MDRTPMAEALFAVVVLAMLPARACWRRRRHAPPTPPLRYILETAALILWLAALLSRRGVPLGALGLHSVLTPRFAFAVLVCLTAVIGLDVISFRLAVRRAGRTAMWAAPPVESPTGTISSRAGAYAFAGVAVVGAVWEELCFRAVGIPLGVWALGTLPGAVVVASFLFGLQHLRHGGVGVAYATFFGLLFSSLYVLTGELIAVIIAHAAGNILAATRWAPGIRARQATAATGVFLG